MDDYRVNQARPDWTRDRMLPMNKIPEGLDRRHDNRRADWSKTKFSDDDSILF